MKKLSDFKEEVESSALITGNFKSLLSVGDRAYRQKINKKIEELNNTLNQLDPTSI